MALNIEEYQLNKQYADGTKLTTAQMDAALQNGGIAGEEGIVKNLNNLRLNLLQLGKEAHGTGNDASFDGDGTPNFTNSLYNKQTKVQKYNGGDFALGAVAGAFTDVDGTNARVVFDPERAGKYNVTCVFTHLIQLNATSEGEAEVIFKISDGTNSSPTVRSGGYYPAPSANAIRDTNPITISFEVDLADTSQKTFSLQKRVMASSNVAINSVAATADSGEFYIKVEKI